MNHFIQTVWTICGVVGAIALAVAFIFLLALVKWKAREIGDIILCHWLTRHSRRELQSRKRAIHKIDKYKTRIDDVHSTERDYLFTPGDVQPANRVFRLRPTLPSVADDDPSSQRN